MSRYVVGVDVGGTFTDVFVWDEAGRVVTTAKVPSTRGDQSRGFVEGIRQRVGDFAELATVVHGTTVGTNALLERKGARTGIITTRGLPRRAGDAPPRPAAHLGPVGHLRAGRAARPAPRGRRARAGRRHGRDAGGAGRGRGAGARAGRGGVRSRSASSSSTATPTPATSGRRSRRCAASGPTAYVTAATEIMPEIREFERLSTATLNAYLQPVVSAYLDRLEGALAEGGFARRRADRPVERRRDDGRDGEAVSRAHGAVRPGGRRHRGARHRAGGGVRERHHLRHGRHLLRRLADRRTARRRWRRRPPSTSAWWCARR